MTFQIDCQSRHVATVKLRAKVASVNYPDHLQACSDRDKAAHAWADQYGASLEIAHSGLTVVFEFIGYGVDTLAPTYAAEDFVRWLEEQGRWECAR